MTDKQRWNALRFIGLLLCFGPSLALGIPSALNLWEWFTVVPIGIAMFGLPQIAMLFAANMTRKYYLSASCIVASALMFGVYCFEISATDLTSSSTASIGVFFFQLYMAIGSTVAFLIIALMLKIVSSKK